MITYMWAAYIVTWVVHIGYLAYLTARANRLKRDIEELNK